MKKRNMLRLSAPLVLAVFGLVNIFSLTNTSAQSVANSGPSFIEPLATSLTFADGQGGSVIGIATGDFNSDGTMDLAVTAYRYAVDSFVSVLLGNGDGTFRTPVNMPIPRPPAEAQARGILARDFDGDGLLDLVVDVGETRQVFFYKGGGDGSFNNPATSNAGGFTNGVQAADLDGNGTLDLVTVNSPDNTVSILLGLGDGTFQPPVLRMTNTNPQDVAIADVDGVNGPDIVAGCYQGTTVDVLLNNGSGGFPAASTRFNARMFLRGLYVADFDGDGRLDIVASGDGGPPNYGLVFIKGNGDGTFQLPPDQNFRGTEQLPNRQYSENVAPDLNGDGLPDLLFSHLDAPFTNKVTVGLGRGDGTFDLREWVASNGPGFTRDDLGRISLADGNGTLSVVASDFNRDGLPDLAVASFQTGWRVGGLSLLLGAGGGDFLAPRAYSAIGFQSSSGDGNDRRSVLSDFNSDGNLDLVAVSRGNVGGACGIPHNVEFFAGNGAGALGAAVGTAFGFCNNDFGFIPALRAADMNLDGNLDLVMPVILESSFATPRIFIANGAGDGTFTYTVGFGSYGAPWRPMNVVVGDFNNDGVPDLAVLVQRGTTCCPSRVFLHFEVFIQDPKQLGRFTRTAEFPQTNLVGGNRTGSVAADLDGDGNLDLVAGGTLGSDPLSDLKVVFLKGNGDGTFQPPVAVGPIPSGQAQAFVDVLAVDLNNDNKLDLVVCNFSFANVYLGNGDGTFQAPVAYASGGGGEPSMEIADLDGDGKLDIAFGNGSGGFTVMRGNGDGSFGSPTYFAIGYLDPWSVRIGDLNNDGKPDVVVRHFRAISSTTVLINNSEP